MIGRADTMVRRSGRSDTMVRHFDDRGPKTGKVLGAGFRAQPVQGADRPLRPYGSTHVRPGLAMDSNHSD
jgi:hypothetical protein